MSIGQDLAGNLTAYLGALKLLALNPATFFAEVKRLPDYKAQAWFALPQVAVFALGLGVLSGKPVLIALYSAGAYAGIAVWTVVLRYVLRFFGEQRGFDETAHIVTCSTLPFFIGWIPVVGGPLLYLGVGFYCYVGLTAGLKMNQGAALAAIALPVVLSGFLGALFSFVFLWIASLSTIFSR